MGLMFPWAGLPIGLLFLMLDDPRKIRLGWMAIGWSVAGTVLNSVLVLLPLAALVPMIKSWLAHPGGGGGGAIPGLPPVGGGEETLTFPLMIRLFQQTLCLITAQTR